MLSALVINPNTSKKMTADIRCTAERVFATPWTCEVVSAPAGPESLESWRDYAVAPVSVLPLLEEHPGHDGVVVSCFGDPGLFGLKEVSAVPVVGIAEASMSIALMIGAKFGVLAGMGRAVALMDSLVRTYGLESRYAGTVGLSIRVLDFDKDRGATIAALAKATAEIQSRGAEAVILGCAGLSGFLEDFCSVSPIPVIDPVDAGCHMLKTLVEGSYQTSRAGMFAVPAPQKMNDLDVLFAPEMIRTLGGGTHEGEQSPSD